MLVGAALHAAERSRLGKAPTDLERVLLKALGDLMPQADVHASGQEYRAAVADLGALDIVPASVTSRPLTSGYTLADFKAGLPATGREAVTLPNAAIVDPAALADGRPIDTAECTEGLTEFGYGATVFNRPPVPSEERGKPVPGYRAKVEFDSFYVRRAVGDQWGGKDEIYWTVAAASDKHKAPTCKSGQFGSIRKGNTRSFSGADRVVFDGQAGTHLGLHVAAWRPTRAGHRPRRGHHLAFHPRRTPQSGAADRPSRVHGRRRHPRRTDGPRRGVRPAPAARALRAALPDDADVLSDAEQRLLREWLTRLAADGGTPQV